MRLRKLFDSYVEILIKLIPRYHSHDNDGVACLFACMFLLVHCVGPLSLGRVHECFFVVGNVRSKLTITRVTNARQNKSIFRNFGIHVSSANVNVWMRLGDLLQSSVRRHDRHDMNLLDSPLL